MKQHAIQIMFTNETEKELAQKWLQHIKHKTGDCYNKIFFKAVQLYNMELEKK